MILSRFAFLSSAISGCTPSLLLSSSMASLSSSSFIVTPNNLVGRTFDIKYASEQSNDMYRFTVKTDKKIAWKRIEGKDVGNGDEEDYVITQLTDSKILITWIEADGLGLSNVLDFTDGTCLTHGNNGRDVWKHTGKLSLVEM